MFRLADGRTYLYQWDVDIKVLLDENENEINEIHFSSRYCKSSYTVEVVRTDSEVYATIPNILLQKDCDVVAYAFHCGNDGSYTTYQKVFEVKGRPRPSNYIYTETEVKNYEVLSDRLMVLEERMDSFGGIVNKVEGESIVLTDSAESKLKSLRVFGKTEQDDTPTPDNPQELVSGGDDGNIEVEVCGANLGVELLSGRFGVTVGELLNNEQSSENNRVKTSVIKNRDYYITSKDAYFQVYVVTGNDKISKSGGWYDLPYHHIADSNENVRFMFRMSNNTDISTDIPIMFSLIDSEFEETQTQICSISTPKGLPGIKVTDVSLATYVDDNGQMWCADEIDFEHGVYVQRIYHKVFDGTEALVKSSSVDNYYLVSDEKVKYNSKSTSLTGSLCNKLVEKTPDSLWSNSKDGFTIGTSDRHIRFRVPSLTDVTSVETFKAKLAEWYANGEPMELITLLATPIETPLTEEELAQYKALHANYPTTTILNDSEAHMKVSYGADMKSYIDRRIKEISNA